MEPRGSCKSPTAGLPTRCGTPACQQFNGGCSICEVSHTGDIRPVGQPCCHCGQLNAEP